MDRRGRGESGGVTGSGYFRLANRASLGNAAYALEREAEDVAAVDDQLEDPVGLLGSFLWALCALEAALQTDNLRKLVLNEPPYSAGRFVVRRCFEGPLNR